MEERLLVKVDGVEDRECKSWEEVEAYVEKLESEIGIQPELVEVVELD